MLLQNIFRGEGGPPVFPLLLLKTMTIEAAP